MVDHLSGHAAVNADVFSGDKAGLLRAKKENHVGDVQRIAHAARRLLRGIGTLIHLIGVVDPAGGDGVDPDPTGQADGQCMG